MANEKRAKGSGSFFKRGDIYYLSVAVNGKRKAHCLHCTTLREAEKKALEKLPKSLQTATSSEEIALHIGKQRGLIADALALPVHQAWQAFQTCPERGDCKQTTLDWYAGIWTRFETWLTTSHPETQTMKDLNRKIISEYAKDLWASGTSASTYNHHVVCLRLVCNAIAEQSGLGENPFKHIEKKRTEKKERLGFTLSDINKIMEVFADESFKVANKEEFKVLFSIGIFTGMRFGDCCMLKWDNVDYHKSLISVTPQKTSRINRKVKIPILPALQDALKVAEIWKVDGYVIPKLAERYGRYLDGIVRDYCSILDKAGFDAVTEGAKREGGQIVKGRGTNRRKYGFHSFRHTFASICASKGVPITTLAEILGDNVTTLQSYYLHPSEEMRAKVTGAMQLTSPDLKVLEVQECAIAPRLSDKEKLKAIVDVISHASASTPELERILKILQS